MMVLDSCPFDLFYDRCVTKSLNAKSCKVVDLPPGITFRKANLPRQTIEKRYDLGVSWEFLLFFMNIYSSQLACDRNAFPTLIN